MERERRPDRGTRAAAEVLSAEFGLNVMFRYLEGRAYGGTLFARSTVLGVVRNGLTTIVGFGSLLIAAHRGIFSLGLLLTIGCPVGWSPR